MMREISIHEVSQTFLRAELVDLTEFLRVLGFERCEVLFGWHWGMEYPPETPWKTMLIDLAEVNTEVQKPEDAGVGELGRDDVRIRVPPLNSEFLFCHHSGIHYTFTPPSEIASHLAARWSAAGLAVVERDCTSDPEPA